jgi:mannitol-1-phosphate 5-dehydrogenase
LGIDVGTSATKVILLAESGKWKMHSWPSSDGVWSNLKVWLNAMLKDCVNSAITRVGITGHGPSVIVIRDGAMVGRPIHWFDEISESFLRPTEGEHILPPTRAWVPSRVAQWEGENGPVGDGVAIQLKDYLNWQIAGIIARDSRSMRGYVGEGFFHNPSDVIGCVNQQGAELSGITLDADVICGCDDLTAGVLGLQARQGQLFNLANTSEHVGLVGGNPVDGLSWLPPLGRLPALCYNATSTGGRTLSEMFDRPPSRESAEDFSKQLTADETQTGDAWKALRKLNQPIEDIRQNFDVDEMLIGGGLTLIPQIVESRNAIARAGQEVSVLGVAKLAQKPLAVIFGAGKVGRGFLAQLLVRAGWRIHFVDSNPSLVESLSSGSYSIVNLGTGEIEEISDFSVSRDSWRLDEASLVMTSLGANGLANWANSMSDFDRPIDIILAENHPRPAALVRSHITSQRVGVAQAQVLRSCIEPTIEQVTEFGHLTVQVQDHWTLPLDADALVYPELVGSVSGFNLRPNFSIELTRKLYTYNAINAAVCYAGASKGYDWLSDAANDPEIAELGRQVGIEASAALVAEFDFDSNDQLAWSNRALAKYQDETIRDPIERNARDPIRKLGLHDRILGPLHLCLSHDLPHDALLETMKHAMNYTEISDDSAIELQQLVVDFGLFGAIEKIAPGLDNSIEIYLRH